MTEVNANNSYLFENGSTAYRVGFALCDFSSSGEKFLVLEFEELSSSFSGGSFLVVVCCALR